MYFLVGIIIIILFIILSYLYIKNKVTKVLNSYGLNSIKDAIEQARLEDEEVPKSLSSMDSIYMESIIRDFPDMNINELKRLSEKIILDSLNAIEKKDVSGIKNGKIKSFVTSQIEDLKNSKIN